MEGIVLNVEELEQTLFTKLTNLKKVQSAMVKVVMT